MRGAEEHIAVKDLSIGYRERVIMRDLNFSVKRGDIFVIMGASGCGKSTLMRSLIGLLSPLQGEIFFSGRSLWSLADDERQTLVRRMGITYQAGALWGALTVAENVALPLEQFTAYEPEVIRDLVALKLALVGLGGFEDYYPAELSGGMRKRAGLARALALDPEILFFDEPSAGLDPVSSRRLDDLLIQLRDVLGSTIVIVTHELASIFAIATNSVYLDVQTQTMLATGAPQDLLINCREERVQSFLRREGVKDGN